LSAAALRSIDHLSNSSPEVRLLLICHAEGMQNRYSELSQRVEQAADSGLTAFGWEQANQLAQWLVTHESIDVLYSGPLLQSRLTAQRLGQTLGLPLTIDERIPGRFSPEIALPSQWKLAQRSVAQFEQPKAVAEDSPYGIYLHSLVDPIESILQANWGRSVALVLSGNGVATAVRHFAGAHALSIAVSHTAITELRRQDDMWSLIYVNRREHLPVAQAPVLHPRVSSSGLDQGSEITQDILRVVSAYAHSPQGRETQVDALYALRMQHFLKFAQLPKESCVLDVGTGNGQLALLLAEGGAREVIGVDISPAMLESAELTRLLSGSSAAARVNFRLAPAHALPFRDERFDAVVCRLVLHHSHQPQAILAELARLLKHKGILVLADLLSAEDPVKRATQNAIEERRDSSHVTVFSLEQVRRLVTAAGLQLDAEQAVTFERNLEEWLNEIQTDAGARSVVREMVEAGLETDAAGLNVRRQAHTLFFEQRLFYVKAVKP
jgi:ubiquinone/menaquinone biosynthesis C-methylase UbiE/broad specificity phosphatase PhoE